MDSYVVILLLLIHTARHPIEVKLVQLVNWSTGYQLVIYFLANFLCLLCVVLHWTALSLIELNRIYYVR